MKRILLATALVASSGVSMAAEGYAGALVGLGKVVSLHCSGVAGCDDSDTAYKVYGGSEFTPALSLEVGYTDFGSAKLNATTQYKATAISAVAAYRLAFSSALSGVARLGLASVSSKAKVVGLEDDSDIRIQPYAGLGVDYTVYKNVKVVGAVEMTKIKQGDHSRAAMLFGAGAQVGF